MYWMPWKVVMKEACDAPDSLLEKRGAGEKFFYGVRPLSDSLYGLSAFREDSLVFFGVCRREEDVFDYVLKDARSRPCWARVEWEQVKGDFPSDLSRLELWGTLFQRSVWHKLLAIPEGRLETYQSIAAKVGNLKASRAVGSAIGANPLAGYIPCHRVVSKSADMNSYRWGSDIKEIFIREEHIHAPFSTTALPSIPGVTKSGSNSFRYESLWI